METVKRKLIIRYSKKPAIKAGFQKFGSSDWTRTSDIRINSPRSTDWTTEESLLRHILTAKNFCQTRFLNFPTVCRFYQQFVHLQTICWRKSLQLCWFSLIIEMWFHFLQLRSALNISSALARLFTALAGTLNARATKCCSARDNPACCSYLHGERLCPVVGVLSTFLVSWLGKDAMAGVGWRTALIWSLWLFLQLSILVYCRCSI